MKESKSKLRSEIFTDKEHAERAYQAALDQGYTPDEITVIMTDDTRKKYYDSFLVKEVGDKSMEGLAVGGALGGTLGATIGAIAAMGTVVAFPGLGLIVAGPIVGALAGAGAGSVSGGLIGALVGTGIPEERAKIYEKGLKTGGIVLVVNEHEGELETLEEIWKKDAATKTTKETTY